MRFLLITLYLSLSVHIVAGQVKDSTKVASPVGFDLYGSWVPLFLGDPHFFGHIHAHLNFKKLGYSGPSISYWDYSNRHESSRFLGLGYKVGPNWEKFILKMELGFLLLFEKEREDFGLELRDKSWVNYIRFHLGQRFGRLFSWGFTLNWIPPSQKLDFSYRHNGSSNFEDYFRRPNRHLSPSFFLGISIR
ncbi:MAG: hypothetical protein AAF696_07550 [Bacteroidota bacterium]